MIRIHLLTTASTFLLNSYLIIDHNYVLNIIFFINITHFILPETFESRLFILRCSLFKQLLRNYGFQFNVHGSVHLIIFQYISNKTQSFTVYFIWKLLYMFRVVPSPTKRSANNSIYSIWYLSHSYCYLPLSWKSWNWF